MIDTNVGTPVSDKLLENYFASLVNSIFKILPIRESEEDTYSVYVSSLEKEILGCKELITELGDDSRFLAIVSTLQYLSDNPDCPVGDVRREVFKAIGVCNKLRDKYAKVVAG